MCYCTIKHYSPPATFRPAANMFTAFGPSDRLLCQVSDSCMCVISQPGINNVHPSTYLPTHPPIHLPINLSIYPSIPPPIYASIHLSIKAQTAAVFATPTSTAELSRGLRPVIRSPRRLEEVWRTAVGWLIGWLAGTGSGGRGNGLTLVHEDRGRDKQHPAQPIPMFNSGELN